MKKFYQPLIILLLIVFLTEIKSSVGKQSVIKDSEKKYILILDAGSIVKLRDLVIKKKAYSMFRVSVKLLNNTKDTLKYISMSCSWNELFHLNDKNFYIFGWPCDTNFPIIRIILPYKTAAFSLPIVKEKGSADADKLRVCMNLLISDKHNEHLVLSIDKTGVLIWSNEVKFQ